MVNYDYVITKLTISSNQRLLTVEKVAVLDDDRLLETWLSEHGIADHIIGEVIEMLEGIPFGSKTVTIGDTIVITQI